MTYSVVCA